MCIRDRLKATYQAQRRGGRGISGMTRKEEDIVQEMFVGSTHDYVLFVTDRGRLFQMCIRDSSKHAPKHMSLANESKPDRKAVIVLTCCALQSACYSPTGIVISFILAQIQGEVQTNLTVKRFLMCSAALCTSIAEELFIISRLSRAAEHDLLP